MEYRGYIRGFSGYTQGQLLKMKQDLSLEMSLPLLAHCATYYKQMRRDPAIAELQLLDRYYQNNRLAPSTCAITELVTNQEFVAHTYHDLLKKRGELLPNANHPCTLEEAFYTATAYLNRGGKKAQLPQKRISIEETAALCGNEDYNNCVFSPNEDSYLQISPKNDAQKPETGDMLILLTSNQSQRRSDYLTSVRKLLNHPEVQIHLIGHGAVTEKGLLDAVVTLAKNGAWIELSRLSKVEEYVPVKMLFDGYQGDLLLRLSAKAPGAVAEIASSLGLRASIFAMVTNDGDLRVSNQGTLDFRVTLPFLRTLAPTRGVDVKLSDEPSSTLNVQHGKNHKNSLAYLPYLQLSRFSSAYVNGTVTAVAQSCPTESFFLHGVYTALTSILTLSLSGCEYPQQRLSFRARIPSDLTADQAVSESLSIALGIYRVQAEYGIPAAAIQTIPSHASDHSQLTVYSTGMGTPCPTRFIQEKNCVYLLKMVNTENGCPDFEEIRRNLCLVEDLRRKGILQSAQILCQKSVTQGLSEMSADGIRCHVKNAKIVSEDREYFSVLLETTRSIPATYIGKTEKTEVQDHGDSTLSHGSTRHIWAEQPEVVILSKTNDPAAAPLARELEKEGAHVQCFSDLPSDGNALSRALLASHFLILCKNVKITETDALRFAYQTFRNAGGKVVSVGNQTSDMADFLFPDGFTKADILKLSNFEEKI